jgi:UDP-2,4-diacetamido-2,4,6-trideoxy-beta-L-altropyranose hydrolase
VNSQPLRVALRADGSASTGLGHVKRCLALALALRETGALPCLVTRELGAQTRRLAEEVGVACFEIDAEEEQDAAATVQALRDWGADWVVADHYRIDARWHHAVAQALHVRMAAIDDLGDRPLSVDLLIDPNYAPDHRVKYASRLSPAEIPMLAGPRFALLGPAYAAAPRYEFHEHVRSIGVFMGGTDATKISGLVVQACRQEVGFRGPIEVATTRANPHLEALRLICERHPATTLSVDAPDLVAFFARHDLQVGAGGGASWERCCIGAPTLALCCASNQQAVIPALAELGVLAIPNPPDTLDPRRIAQSVTALLADARRRNAMSTRSRELVDGLGARRVALWLNAAALTVRPAAIDDARRMHDWRNHPATRHVSLDAREITWPVHLDWLRRTLANPDRVLLIGSVGNIAVGVIRLDRLAECQIEVSLYLDPALHGLGLGAALLRSGEHHVARIAERPSHGFVATVLQNNPGSQRLFASAGYRQSGGARWYKPVQPPITRNSP